MQFGPEHLAQVRAGIRALGDRRLPVGTPQSVVDAAATKNREDLAAYLRSVGLCAFAGQEAVFEENFDHSWSEWHAVSQADAGFTQDGRFIGIHVVKPGSVPTPLPTPTPTPVPGACPAQPCPVKVWTRETLPPGWGDNEIGQPAWKWNSATWGGTKIRDYTPVTIRQLDYCISVGFNDPSQPPRASCPMRKEEGPDRALIEQWLTGGYQIQSRNGQECAIDDRPSMTANGTGNCRMCNAAGTVCSDWQ